MANLVTWVKAQAGNWLALRAVDLSNVTKTGVYIIWHGGQTPRVVKVGQGSIADRVGKHRNDPAILAFEVYGPLSVTWATVPAAQLDGVERYLGDYWKPLVADRFPNALPIAVNQPF